MVELHLLALFDMGDRGTLVIKRSLEVLDQNTVFMEHRGEPRLDDYLRNLHEKDLQVFGNF